MTDHAAEPVTDLDAALDGDGVGELDPVDEQLIAQLAGRARVNGLDLTGANGLLAQLTKRVLESALEGEITDHLGYEAHDPGLCNERWFRPDTPDLSVRRDGHCE